MYGTVLRRLKYLTPSVRYKSLACYVLEGTYHPGINDACGSDSSIVLGYHSSSDDKLPGFKIPKFERGTLMGDIFLKKIHDTFKSAGQALYLEDEAHCAQWIAWSGIFASCIRKSVADSAILGFLSPELEQEDNCAIVFQKISDHLSSSDLATVRIFEAWMQFFKLKCSTRDDFLEFFSSAKSILHKLKTANSVAVTDACRGAAKAKSAATDRRDSPSPSFTPFPANIENKMPHHIYKQVAEWCPHAARRNDKDKA